MIVVDASVMAVALADAGADGALTRSRLRGEALAAPELLDLEVVSVWRRLVQTGGLSSARAGQAIDDLRSLPLMRAPHQPLLPRIWALRENLTTYDGAYVALAELTDSSLVTRDVRLARAPGLACHVDLL